jgi:hypothetical protein
MYQATVRHSMILSLSLPSIMHAYFLGRGKEAFFFSLPSSAESIKLSLAKNDDDDDEPG